MTINTFEFVLLDPPSNLKPGRTSSQIRSRCMQGKNKRDGSRRSRQEEGKKKKNSSLQNQSSEEQQQQTRGAVVVVGQSMGPEAQALPSRTHLAARQESCGLRALTHPRFPSPDMRLLNPGSSLVVEAFAFDITNRSLSPFDACVAFESIPGHMAPFSELRSDALFMHSIMATGTALHDFAIKTPGPTRQTAVQLHNTLSLLRVKLLDPLAYREEAVVHAVLSLAMLAGGFGHWGATVVHLQGLQRIVGLNGGAEFLARWPKLCFKLGRIDLVWCLSSGKDPFFTEAPESRQPGFTSLPSCRIVQPSDMLSPPTEWGAPMVSCFADLQALSSQINLAARAGSRYDAAQFCSTLASLQSRLLYLRRSTRSLGLYNVPQFPYVDPIAIDVQDPMREFVRLVMLAFMTTTFRALGDNMPFQWVGAQLAEIVPKVCEQRVEGDGEFLLWGLAVVGISVVSPRLRWFRRAWMEIAEGGEWDVVRRRLMKVMWIEIVHDAAGEAMFGILQDSEHE